MRVDKEYPWQRYNHFWHWLSIGWHSVWLLSLFLGYVYYLATTEEV